MMQIRELDALNDEMQGELNQVQLLHPQKQLDQVEKLEEHYDRYVQ